MTPDRVSVPPRSVRKLDPLDPDPDAWADEDLATDLSRTHRRGGHPGWERPLSVAQHGSPVPAIREGSSEVCRATTAPCTRRWRRPNTSVMSRHFGPQREGVWIVRDSPE